MTLDVPTARTLSTDSNEPASLICTRCEYDLRGLPRDGRCPECGESIRTSIAADAAAAKPFVIARWLRQSSIGAVWLIIPAIVAFVPELAYLKSDWVERCTPIVLVVAPLFAWLGCRGIASNSAPWPERATQCQLVRRLAALVMLILVPTGLLQLWVHRFYLYEWWGLTGNVKIVAITIASPLGWIASALLYWQLSFAAERLRLRGLQFHALATLALLCVPFVLAALYSPVDWGWYFPQWIPAFGWLDTMTFYIWKLRTSVQNERLTVGILLLGTLWAWPIINTLLMIHLVIAMTIVRRRERRKLLSSTDTGR